MSGYRGTGLASTGWVAFAGMTMILIGVFNLVEGIVMLFANDVSYLVADRLVVVDVTGFGWALIISGVILSATGAGLLSAKGWSRIAGVVVVSLHAISQIAWFGAYPVWSILMLGLDVTVLWAVTAGWSSAQENLGDSPSTTHGALV